MVQNLTSEANRCIKCQTEIEPQYYYCENCLNKKRKRDLIVAIALTILVFFIAGSIPVIFKLQLGFIPAFLYYSAEFGIIGFIWKMYINAEPPLKDIPEEKAKTKVIIKEEQYTEYVVGTFIPEGRNCFTATKPNGGFVYIYPHDGSEHKRIYVEKKKNIKLNSGDRIKLIYCELSKNK